MGKPMRSDAMASMLANHYPGVRFAVAYDENKGKSTCSVKINTTQAIAGQNFKEKPAVQLSKDAGAKIADLAHNQAVRVYEDDHPDKTVPKKMSGGDIYGS